MCEKQLMFPSSYYVFCARETKKEKSSFFPNIGVSGKTINNDLQTSYLQQLAHATVHFDICPCSIIAVQVLDCAHRL